MLPAGALKMKSEKYDALIAAVNASGSEVWSGWLGSGDTRVPKVLLIGEGPTPMGLVFPVSFELHAEAVAPETDLDELLNRVLRALPANHYVFAAQEWGAVVVVEDAYLDEFLASGGAEGPEGLGDSIRQHWREKRYPSQLARA